MLTDRRTTDTGVTGILIDHIGAFGSGELKSQTRTYKKKNRRNNKQLINIKTTSLELAASEFETTWFLCKLSILDDNRAPV